MSEEPKKPEKRVRKDGSLKPVPVGVVWPEDTMAKIKVLAKGLDRTVSWVIRDLVEGGLASNFSELEQFANDQVAEEDRVASKTGVAATEQSSARLVQRLLLEEKERNLSAGKQHIAGQSKP